MARVSGTAGRKARRQLGKASTSELRPPVPEHMSAAHPEWQAQEIDFVLSESRRGLAFPKPRDVDDADPRYAIDEIEYVKRLHDSRTRDGAILELIERVGTDVFWPRPLYIARVGVTVDAIDRKGRAVLRDEIRTLVRDRIEAAYVDVRHGETLAERHGAHEFLLGLGKALAGDQRGRREGVVVKPLEVRKTYHRYMFSAGKALELLQVWPFGGTLADKIRDVSTACEFDEAELRKLLLTCDGERRPAVRVDRIRTLRAPWLEEHARTWTALMFEITEQTVANILAPSGVRESSLSAKRRRPPIALAATPRARRRAHS